MLFLEMSPSNGFKNCQNINVNQSRSYFPMVLLLIKLLKPG